MDCMKYSYGTVSVTVPLYWELPIRVMCTSNEPNTFSMGIIDDVL